MSLFLHLKIRLPFFLEAIVLHLLPFWQIDVLWDLPPYVTTLIPFFFLSYILVPRIDPKALFLCSLTDRNPQAHRWFPTAFPTVGGLHPHEYLI